MASLESHKIQERQRAKYFLDNLKCTICERMKKTAPARPANPFRARKVGEVLALDFSYHVSSDGQRLMVLNLIDEASKFHVAKIIRRVMVKKNLRPWKLQCTRTYSLS